jgi:hypothetical protein
VLRASAGTSICVKVASILKPVLKGLVEVMECQLKELLPGGMHHNVEDKSRRRHLEHSRINNPVWESSFEDLDHSKLKDQMRPSITMQRFTCSLETTSKDSYFNQNVIVKKLKNSICKKPARSCVGQVSIMQTEMQPKSKTCCKTVDFMHS